MCSPGDGCQPVGSAGQDVFVRDRPSTDTSSSPLCRGHVTAGVPGDVVALRAWVSDSEAAMVHTGSMRLSTSRPTVAN